MIESCNALESRVRHRSVRVQTGEPTRLQQGDDLVPVARVPDLAFCSALIDRKERHGLRGDVGLSRRERRDEIHQRLPARHPLRPRDQGLRVGQRDFVARILRLLSPAQVETDVPPHRVPAAPVAEILPDDLHRVGLARPVGRDQRLCDPLVASRE